MLKHDFVNEMSQALKLKPLQLQRRVMHLFLGQQIAFFCLFILALVVDEIVKAIVAGVAVPGLSLALLIGLVLVDFFTFLADFEVLGVAREDVARHVGVKTGIVLLALDHGRLRVPVRAESRVLFLVHDDRYIISVLFVL